MTGSRLLPGRRRLAVLAGAVALTTGQLTGGSLTAAADEPPPQPVTPGASTTSPRHSSDGVRGPVAAGEALPRAFRVAAPRAVLESRQVSPGVTYESWRELTPRGALVGHVVRVDLRTPGVKVEYASMGTSRQRAPLTEVLARRATAVAGVNGDFFDIDDTGAPLGAAVSGATALGGPRSGWVRSFSVIGRQDAGVRTTSVWARIARRPGIRITGMNTPHVPPGGIGLYTPTWGQAAGRSVVDGAPQHRTRQVVVRNGRVRSNSRVLTTGHSVVGHLLVGRGEGATRLRRLKVGTRANITYGVVPVSTPRGAVVPRMAVGGSVQLVRGGAVVATDDTELHPRTAVGIDRDTATLLLVVIDGRSVTSRGHTLLELARTMADLGADDALNLDGGGSSTVAARGAGNALEVENSPSSGTQRPVPNGISVTYAPSAG
jgi:hypothetical protein